MLANEFKIHVKKKGKILLTKHTHVGCDDKLITYQLIETCFMQQMTTIRNVTWITRCMNITQTYRTIWTWYIFHTLSINTILKWKSKLFWLEFIIFYLIYKHTRWPFVFSCNGKHILQTSQWKKLFLPPIRQIPHPLQWYWSLSSSSNRLQIRHVYCKHVNIKKYCFSFDKSNINWLIYAIFMRWWLPFRNAHHNFGIQLGLFVVYHILCKLIRLMFFCQSDDLRFRHDSIDNYRIFHSMASRRKQENNSFLYETL